MSDSYLLSIHFERAIEAWYLGIDNVDSNKIVGEISSARFPILVLLEEEETQKDVLH